MKRRERREHTFCMLFCKEFYKEAEMNEQMRRYLEFCAYSQEEELTERGMYPAQAAEFIDADRNWLIRLVADICEKIPEIDEKINSVATGWRTSRMGKVDLTILRLAFYEILYDETIPEKVSINEAVELSKKYGGDDTPAFVNGILAKVVK